MSWTDVDAFLARHHLLAALLLVAATWKLLRPPIVEGVACVRAIMRHFGISTADVDAERSAAEKSVPELPDVLPAAVQAATAATAALKKTG